MTCTLRQRSCDELEDAICSDIVSIEVIYQWVRRAAFVGVQSAKDGIKGIILFVASCCPQAR